MTDEDPSCIGDWERKDILGTGSFGQVTLWKNKIKKEQIAIKKCTAIFKNISTPDYEKLKSRWTNELNIMQQAKCDYIVRAIKVQPNNFIDILNKTNLLGFPLLVMEYCNGGNLRQLLCKIENCNGLNEFEIRNILKCLRNAIKYLHDNDITHRDLKPENILIQNRNGVNFYKLADLGYAKEMVQTLSHSVVGTMEYIAPEIISSTQYSMRVDYWSMGIIVFEIICGIRPFLPNTNMITRICELKQKTSKEIAIMETNIKTKFKKYEHLFHENHVTKHFRLQIEEWLRLALQFNEKQRGSEFIIAPDEIQTPPQCILKFYTKLDDILNTKILTIFSLINYKFLSYPLNRLNNLNDLKIAIEHDTQIPIQEIYFILPMEQTNIQEVTPNTNPIDLYLEDLHNSPMIYITRYRNILERKSIDQPHISELIVDIMHSDDNDKLELSCLKEFGRQVLFLYRNLQKHYVELLKGLKTYAINLNDSIVKLDSLISIVNNKTMIACANISLHVNLISYSKHKIEENTEMFHFSRNIINEWDAYLDNLADDYKLQEINAKNQKRYESVLRRSKEAINSEIFEIRDFFNVKKLEDIYDRLRKSTKLSDELMREAKNTLKKRCYECIEIRENLLKAPQLEHIQHNISTIHSEFTGIFEITQILNIKLDDYEPKIMQASIKHQDQMCQIYENFTKQKIEKELKNNVNRSLNGVIEQQHTNSIINRNAVQNGEQSHISTSNEMDISLEDMETKDLLFENSNFLMQLSLLSNRNPNE